MVFADFKPSSAFNKNNNVNLLMWRQSLIKRSTTMVHSLYLSLSLLYALKHEAHAMMELSLGVKRTHLSASLMRRRKKMDN